MLGVVNLDKPVGPTSHDMVALVRRITGERRVGHAGTLDPLASGVLPILVGPATRLSEELSGGWKRYDATIRLGARSLTDDAQGPITPGSAPLPDRARLDAALDAFRGEFDQRPPAFSARKAGGRTAHRAARAGMPLELPARRVTVELLEVLGVEEADGALDVRVDVRCTAGTYIRSIARDVGELLGCGGYLAALRRTEATGLPVEDALAPEQLMALAAAGRVADALVPPQSLIDLDAVTLDDAAARRFATGLPVADPAAHAGRRLVLHAAELLGIGEAADGQLRPIKVLASTAPE